MTDVDRLRAALREPVALAPVDVERVMAAGTRIRRRRRLRDGAAAVVGVAVVMVIVLGAGWLRPGVVQPAERPSLTVTSPAQPTSLSGKRILGDVIRTGDMHEGELVFYMYPINAPELPEIRFGLVAGRMSEGRITDQYAINETVGSDKAPGFHGASIASGAGRIPAFGYYSGPAVKITALIGGTVVAAHLASWSSDTSVKVWWFDYSVEEPSKLAAFDAAGRPLPVGDNGFGRG